MYTRAPVRAPTTLNPNWTKSVRTELAISQYSQMQFDNTARSGLAAGRCIYMSGFNA